MSIVDDVVAAVTPVESSEDRAEARARARDAAEPGDWLELILDHHLQLEAAFAAVASADAAAGRSQACKQLGIVLTRHAGAEETVIYPAMARAGDEGDADHAYDEQVMVKKEMAALEQLDPMSREFLDKLEAIRESVAHHMYEEEGTWFFDLKTEAPAQDQATLTRRYKEEFDRYAGSEAGAFGF